MLGIPPGLNRTCLVRKFTGFDRGKWQAMKSAIRINPAPQEPSIFGSDISGDMLDMTRHNLKAAGITFDIPLHQIEAQEIRLPTEKSGIILTNPPYGERIECAG